MTRDSNGELQFRTPQGWALPAVPKPSAPPAAPVDELKTQNAALGLDIDAHTSTPSWLGDRLDLGWTISVIHPLACQPNRVVGALKIPSFE